MVIRCFPARKEAETAVFRVAASLTLSIGKAAASSMGLPLGDETCANFPFPLEEGDINHLINFGDFVHVFPFRTNCYPDDYPSPLLPSREINSLVKKSRYIIVSQGLTRS